MSHKAPQPPPVCYENMTPMVSPAPPPRREDPPVYIGDSGSLSKRELLCLLRDRNREIARLKATIRELRP